jgi:hypothetical protein
MAKELLAIFEGCVREAKDSQPLSYSALGWMSSLNVKTGAKWLVAVEKNKMRL